MSKKNSNPALVILGLLIFVIFELIIFVAAIFIFVKRKEINVKKWLIILSALLILLGWIFPVYYTQPFQEIGEFISIFYKTIQAGGILNILGTYFLSFGRFSFFSHFFFLHTSIIIVFSFYIFYENALSITGLKSEIANMNRPPRKEPTYCLAKQIMPNKTAIGFKGKKVVTTDDNARHVFVCGTAHIKLVNMKQRG